MTTTIISKISHPPKGLKVLQYQMTIPKVLQSNKFKLCRIWDLLRHRKRKLNTTFKHNMKIYYVITFLEEMASLKIQILNLAQSTIGLKRFCKDIMSLRVVCKTGKISWQTEI